MVIIITVVLALIAGFSANLAYNQRRLRDAASGKRIKIYYCAQAGLVVAMWQIRHNVTGGLTPAGSFTDPAYDPAPYSWDVAKEGWNDVTVDIGPVTNLATGQRLIVSTGLDRGS